MSKSKAKAPRPKAGGYEAANERKRRAAEVFRITVDPDGDDPHEFEIAMHAVPMRTRARVRSEMQMTVEALLFGRGDFGLDTYCALDWIHRLNAGDVVTFDDVVAEWDRRWPDLTPDDVLDVKADGGDPPEADGQGS